MQGVQVRSLVRELRSHMPWGPRNQNMKQKYYYDKILLKHQNIINSYWFCFVGGPLTGEPGGLLSMGWHRVGHDWSDLAAAAAAAATTRRDLPGSYFLNQVLIWSRWQIPLKKEGKGKKKKKQETIHFSQLWIHQKQEPEQKFVMLGDSSNYFHYIVSSSERTGILIAFCLFYFLLWWCLFPFIYIF